MKTKTPQPAAILTTKQLDALGREWQAKLRLQDWRIRYVLASDVSETSGSGHCNHFYDLRQATIVIKPLEFLPSDRRDPMEQTLIHELLHLYFAGFDYKTDQRPEHDLTETAVESIAWALFRLKYPDWSDYHTQLA